MKTATRWTCRLVRLRIALTETPAESITHVRRCAACQAHLARLHGLTSALGREARDRREPTPPDLEAAILRSVRREPPRAKTRERPGLGWVIPAIGVAALAAIVLAVPLWAPRPGHQRSNTTVGATARTSMASNAPAPVSADGNTFLNLSVPAVLQQDPLQSEATSVYADARGALRFLAMNFLPGNGDGEAIGFTQPRPSGG